MLRHPRRRSAALLLVAPLHGGPPSVPLPPWLVLFVAVLGLWAVIAAGVLAGDALFERFGETR